MPFDYSKLRGRIIELYGSQAAFSKLMGISSHSLSLKMNGKRVWTQKEISKAIDLLELKKDDIKIYFFNEIVQNI